MANKNIPIIRLKESDIISQSMNIINQNFDTIVNNYDISNFKWEQYSKKITDEIEKLKRHCDKSNIDIARSVDSLNTRIDNITDLNDIQTQINNAIMNANQELTGFISDLAGQQVANAMGGYVKTSTLDNKLKGYVASSAFETYKSDAKNRTAYSSLIVANSKFATIKDNGVDYLMNLDGTKSIYKNTEEYWNAIKDTVDQTGKGLEDEEIFNKFLQKCEETFRTVSTELANISMTVEDGVSATAIVNAVKGTPGAENDGDIVAAIFMDANARTGQSSITLNANNFKINSDNFKVNVDGDHKVVVKGELEATKLTINGCNLADPNGAREFVQSYQSHDGGGSGDSDYEPYDDGWLTGAFSKTEVDGGLLLAGNILVGDSVGTVTAGMMGANNDSDDLRIFAGSNDFNSRESSPFRVYKSGKLIAKDAEIIGKVTASELVINDDSFLNNLTVKHITAENDGTLSTVIDPGIFQIRYGGETVVDFFVNDEGYVTLRFKGPDGTWITIDGKNGFQQLSDITVVPSGYIPVKLAPFGSEDIDVITYYLRNPSQYSDLDITVPSVVTYYRYSVGYMVNTKTSEKKYYNINTGKYDLTSIPSENGKIFTQQDARSQFLANVSYSYPNVKGEYDPNASYFAYPAAIDYGSYVSGDDVWVYNASLVSISNGVINTNVGTLQICKDAHNPMDLSAGNRVLTSNRNISGMDPDH